MGVFTFNIVAPIGVVKTYPNGWSKEVNIVSFCHNEPKVDIRDWSPDHTKMGKGMSLTDEEVEQVCMILHNYMRERGAK